MCDPAGKNKLMEMANDTADEHADATTELHSVVCGDEQHNICSDPDHRKLAICSIICGLSCLGIMSLMYSVKSRETRKTLQNEDQTQRILKVKEYSKKALIWGIISIVAWVVLFILLPLLIGLGSYLVTFID